MKTLYALIAVIVVGVIVWFGFFRGETVNQVANVQSFQDCADAGYPVMESYPRQCKTPDGRTYTEEIPEKITYINASNDLIVVDMPTPGSVTGKEFTISGKARGTWFFEASFPVKVLDKDGNQIFIGPAQAQSEWMTEDFVPYKIVVKVPESYIGKATVVMERDNPSGEAQYDRSISFPITIEY